MSCLSRHWTFIPAEAPPHLGSDKCLCMPDHFIGAAFGKKHAHTAKDIAHKLAKQFAIYFGLIKKRDCRSRSRSRSHRESHHFARSRSRSHKKSSGSTHPWYQEKYNVINANKSEKSVATRREVALVREQHHSTRFFCRDQ